MDICIEKFDNRMPRQSERLGSRAPAMIFTLATGEPTLSSAKSSWSSSGLAIGWTVREISSRQFSSLDLVSPYSTPSSDLTVSIIPGKTSNNLKLDKSFQSFEQTESRRQQ